MDYILTHLGFTKDFNFYCLSLCLSLCMRYYPYMPIGTLGIYRLLFFIFYPVRRIFGNGYLGRVLMWADVILQYGRSRSLPGHLPIGELWPRG